MRVIAWKRLREFGERYPDAMAPLTAWYRVMEKSDFATPHALKQAFPKVSILKGGYVVFNIEGNKYRLATRIAYRTRVVFTRWIGTHEEYDEQDFG